MHFSLIAAAAFYSQQATAVTGEDPGEAIVVTASREPISLDLSPVSATVYDAGTIEALGLPFASDILRLTPGVAIASSGPKGTQTQVRIRGAEASHTLLFVDGIEFNDPAATNQARFELLTNDVMSRIEVVRGPQSALWGSEALGGVVSVESADPTRDRGLSLLGEYGSLESYRGSVQSAQTFGALGLSGGAGWMGSKGIDSFGSGGDLDGFDNRSANLKAVVSPLPSVEIGMVGHWIESRSEFDGQDMLGRRIDSLDRQDNEILGLRAWGSARPGNWALTADAGLLNSSNRNILGDDPLNSTFGKRESVSGQVSRFLGNHRLTAAVEHEKEHFRTEGQSVFGAPDQDRSRSLTAFAGEWRAEWNATFATNLALRHDDFSRFKDTTTFRASALLRPAAEWTLHASYGEGIAQPEFYDLFGFFPGSFVGNPDLRPERSQGWEAGLRWRGRRAATGITGFTNRLQDEIVGTFDPATFLSSTENADGKSKRRGIELDAEYRFSDLAGIFLNYSLLDADEQRTKNGTPVRELRRPKHSANAMLAGASGRLSWGATLAYVGKRQDEDFDFFPSPRVTLEDYVLGSLKLGYRLTQKVEAYVRVENAFDSQYQDVFGYNTAGRTVYAGLRIRH